MFRTTLAAKLITLALIHSIDFYILYHNQGVFTGFCEFVAVASFTSSFSLSLKKKKVRKIQSLTKIINLYILLSILLNNYEEYGILYSFILID